MSDELVIGHGLDPCNDCAVAPGTPHLNGCDVARCMFTGEQRLGCDRHEHDDCGDDVWTGRWDGLLLDEPA